LRDVAAEDRFNQAVGALERQAHGGFVGSREPVLGLPTHPRRASQSVRGGSWPVRGGTDVIEGVD
jgi:hypothetical protein